MIIPGQITDFDPETGTLTIKATCTDAWDVARKEYSQVSIELSDGRTISGEQRRKAFALEADIGRWAGYITAEDRAELHDVLKSLYCDATHAAPFSLADCTVTTAREYISFLIRFALRNDIPCLDSLLNRTDDTDAYLYACMWYRKCAICGQPADIHHVDRVGMGRNRDEISHVGMEAMALCRLHHETAHGMGQPRFNEFYHVYGIKIDKILARHLGLGKEK